MKGRILAGALSVSLLLTGCASMLTREYGSVEPHSATLVSEGDANTLRAESYQDVVNGLIYFINRGRRAAPSGLTGRSRMSGPCWMRPVWRWSRRTLWGRTRWSTSNTMWPPL